MCDAMSAISIGTMLVGGYMQQQAQEDAADRQQSAINRALEDQDRYSRQAEQKAMENAQQYAPEKRTQRFEEARDAAGDSLVQQLTQSRESAPTIDQAGGRISKEFETASAKSQADEYQRSVDVARLMGRMRGVNDMLTGEGYTNADYASQLDLIGTNARGSARAAEYGIKAAGRVDGGLDFAGGLMQGLGSLGLRRPNMGRLATGMMDASGTPSHAVNTVAPATMFA